MVKISEALEKIQAQMAKEKGFRETPLNVISGKQFEKETETFIDKELPLSEEIKDQNLHENLVTVLKPQSYEAEQFRILKSKLLFPTEGTPPRSILITSAVPGEGKSFVSSNTAVSIAQNINEHVLLMDCDIRSPTIHKYFGFDHPLKGLSDYLSDDIPLASVLLKANINKLTILPGGKTPKNPAELLSSIKMSELVDELIERYNDRYIIIDSPPLNLISETNVLAKLVDKVIIVINYRKTKREMVSDLIESIGKEKILGIVLNKFDAGDISYGYHKYYKNYSYSGRK